MQQDTSIIKGLSPSGRIYGMGWRDAVVILVSFFPIIVFANYVCPPIMVSFDPLVWLNTKPLDQATRYDLNPYLPTFVLWVLFAITYVRLVSDKPPGFLEDLKDELFDGFEVLFGSPDPNLWESGAPDTEIDTYLLEVEPQVQDSLTRESPLPEQPQATGRDLAGEY